ncbi:prolipoprotein diacylglyceryl transferase [Demequina maris]|uniref:prolipoprotein diacylglyceryl transferase n=1 Tax=Demequina maris TaxID=1638982 RepID=UPI00078029EF|nr:prolipoprotein diacylglyceryl transferase [Demequina maris]
MTTSIPSPPIEWSSFSVGPLTIHAYALWILLGILVALWLTTRRWVERGGDPEVVGDIAFWAIPFGIIGGRLYHVITTPAPYWGPDGNPWDALKIWNGGLGIWGAVALGALGAWIGARRAGVSFTAFADSAAPAVLIAQAIGRMGNYFNQELFGRPTDLPWALEIDPGFRPDGYEQFATFHPTFLYEMVWNLAGAALIIYLDRRLRLYGGRVFWLYVMVYVSGRLWIEHVRIDDAVHILGLRINEWVSIIVLAGSTAAFAALGWRQRKAAQRPDRSRLAARASHPEDTAAQGEKDSPDVADTHGDGPAGA